MSMLNFSIGHKISSLFKYGRDDGFSIIGKDLKYQDILGFIDLAYNKNLPEIQGLFYPSNTHLMETKKQVINKMGTPFKEITGVLNLPNFSYLYYKRQFKGLKEYSEFYFFNKKLCIIRKKIRNENAIGIGEKLKDKMLLHYAEKYGIEGPILNKTQYKDRANNILSIDFSTSLNCSYFTGNDIFLTHFYQTYTNWLVKKAG